MSCESFGWKRRRGRRGRRVLVRVPVCVCMCACVCVYARKSASRCTRCDDERGSCTQSMSLHTCSASKDTSNDVWSVMNTCIIFAANSRRDRTNDAIWCVCVRARVCACVSVRLCVCASVRLSVSHKPRQRTQKQGSAPEIPNTAASSSKAREAGVIEETQQTDASAAPAAKTLPRSF